MACVKPTMQCKGKTKCVLGAESIEKCDEEYADILSAHHDEQQSTIQE